MRSTITSRTSAALMPRSGSSAKILNLNWCKMTTQMDPARMTRWLDGQQLLAAVNAGTDAKVAGIITSTKKEDRGYLSIYNPSAYTKLKYYAELGMDHKFALIKTIDMDDDLEALKEIYNMTVRVEEFKNELVQYNIAHPFENIADDFDTDGIVHFPSSGSTGRNPFSGHKYVSLEHVHAHVQILDGDWTRIPH